MSGPRFSGILKTAGRAWTAGVIIALLAGFADAVRAAAGRFPLLTAARLGFRTAAWTLPAAAVFAFLGSFSLKLLKPRPEALRAHFDIPALAGFGIFPLIFVVLFEKTFNVYEAAIKAGLVCAATAAIFALVLSRRKPRAEAGTASRRLFLFALAGTAAIIGFAGFAIFLPWVPSGSAPARAKQAGGPNVVLVIMDSARADRFSIYGYGRRTSPFLEKFAAEATVFDNAFAESPWTLPAHATLFTGLYPGQHNTHAEHFWLDDAYRTLAEILSDGGYRTALFSNNDYVSKDTNLAQGFGRVWFKGRWTDDPRLNAAGIGKAGEAFLEFCRSEWDRRVRMKFAKNPASLLDYPNAAVTNRAVGEWLERRRDDGAPFFVCINYMDVHFPYNPNDEFAKMFLDPKDLERSYSLRLRRPPIEYCLDLAKGKYSPDELRIINALYDADVSFQDSELEVLCSKLRTLGLYDRTAVIVTSDHGEYLGTHNRLAHGLGLNDDVLHIPLLARLPGVFLAGARDGGLVRLADIFTTALALAGVEERPKGMTGTRTLFGPAPDEGRPVFSEFRFPVHVLATVQLRDDNSALLMEQKSVRGRNAKLIWKSRGAPEFYDLEADPAETKNLYSPDNATAQKMLRDLAAWMFTDIPQEKGVRTIRSPEENARLIERLRTLGYVK